MYINKSSDGMLNSSRNVFVIILKSKLGIDEDEVAVDASEVPFGG